MSTSEIVTLVRNAGLTVFSGYAKTGSLPPYAVVRPMTSDHDDLTLAGSVMVHDTRFSLYCVGASVDASYNLSLMAIGAIQGKRVAGDVASCSLGYVGALVESRYETQVTIQIDQGELS